jgi:hypothetical protein
MPEYSVQPPSAAEAASATTHMNLIVAIVVGAALVVVLVYGPRNLPRHPREVSSAPGVESSESRPPRVR